MSDTDEITRLRAEVEQWKQGHAAACGLAERHMEEKHRLRAENERLRAALREVMDDLTLISKNHWLPVGLLDDVIYVNARAALDGQPAPGKEGA